MGRDYYAGEAGESVRVSIHAPRVGRDTLVTNVVIKDAVSIHAPRVGRDQVRDGIQPQINVSIHAPRVGRDDARISHIVPSLVSIHAPRVGRDTTWSLYGSTIARFNPRAPRGARPTASHL